MEFDFTTVINRHGWDAQSWDNLGQGNAPQPPKAGFDCIPMWIADMNFATVPTVPEALARRAAHPIYGYFQPSDAYYEAISQWHQTQKGTAPIPREAIAYDNSVLGGIASAMAAICPKGGPVLLHTPGHVGFTRVLKANGYNMVLSPLVRDGNGVWRMDFDHMEQAIREHHIHAAILCSPHNPSGRVWERWELEQAMELFQKYDVYVISDEIWSDLLLDGHCHVPTQSLSEDAKLRAIGLYAPSKTFNLAGLIGSYRIIYNPRLRDRVEQESGLSFYNHMNVMTMHALIAAYSSQGARWMQELRQVLSDNVHYAVSFIQEHFPGVEAAMPQATYLLYLDCTGWCEAHSISLEQLLVQGSDVGVGWQDGRKFGGKCHIRMNVALPRTLLEEAFSRLKQFVFTA